MIKFLTLLFFIVFSFNIPHNDYLNSNNNDNKYPDFVSGKGLSSNSKDKYSTNFINRINYKDKKYYTNSDKVYKNSFYGSGKSKKYNDVDYDWWYNFSSQNDKETRSEMPYTGSDLFSKNTYGSYLLSTNITDTTQLPHTSSIENNDDKIINKKNIHSYLNLGFDYGFNLKLITYTYNDGTKNNYQLIDNNNVLGINLTTGNIPTTIDELETPLVKNGNVNDLDPLLPPYHTRLLFLYNDKDVMQQFRVGAFGISIKKHWFNFIFFIDNHDQSHLLIDKFSNTNFKTDGISELNFINNNTDTNSVINFLIGKNNSITNNLKFERTAYTVTKEEINAPEANDSLLWHGTPIFGKTNIHKKPKDRSADFPGYKPKDFTNIVLYQHWNSLGNDFTAPNNAYISGFHDKYNIKYSFFRESIFPSNTIKFYNPNYNISDIADIKTINFVYSSNYNNKGKYWYISNFTPIKKYSQYDNYDEKSSTDNSMKDNFFMNSNIDVKRHTIYFSAGEIVVIVFSSLFIIIPGSALSISLFKRKKKQK